MCVCVVQVRVLDSDPRCVPPHRLRDGYPRRMRASIPGAYQRLRHPSGTKLQKTCLQPLCWYEDFKVPLRRRFEQTRGKIGCYNRVKFTEIMLMRYVYVYVSRPDVCLFVSRHHHRQIS